MDRGILTPVEATGVRTPSRCEVGLALGLGAGQLPHQRQQMIVPTR